MAAPHRELIECQGFTGTIVYNAASRHLPKKDLLAPLLGEAYAGSNTNNFILGSCVVEPHRARATSSERQDFEKRVKQVTWLEERILRIYEPNNPELYCIEDDAGVPHATVMLRSFDDAGRVCGVATDGAQARSATLMDLLQIGLLSLPLRLGPMAYPRLTSHSDNGAQLHKRFAQLNGRHKRIDQVCTRSRLQGRGLQGKLCRRVIADADDDTKFDPDGTVLYLSSSDTANQDYYKRFGFVEVGSIKTAHLVTVGMARLPRRRRERGGTLMEVHEIEPKAGSFPRILPAIAVLVVGLALRFGLCRRT